MRLSKGFQEDIHWWIQFTATFNGKAKILGKFALIQGIYSDASNWGYGTAFNNDWLVGTFHESNRVNLGKNAGHHYDHLDTIMDDAHINVKEMSSVFEAALRWSHLWSICCVLFMTDGATVQSTLLIGR